MFHMPMSSPIMTTMFGRCVWACAATVQVHDNVTANSTAQPRIKCLGCIPLSSCSRSCTTFLSRIGVAAKSVERSHYTSRECPNASPDRTEPIGCRVHRTALRNGRDDRRFAARFWSSHRCRGVILGQHRGGRAVTAGRSHDSRMEGADLLFETLDGACQL